MGRNIIITGCKYIKKMINTINKKARGRMFVIIVIVALIVALSWILIANNNVVGRVVSGNEPIKIGIIGHFSGDYAAYGIPMKNAVILAVEEVNNAGGINGKQIELVVEDDTGDSVKASFGINKLINVDGVDYVISAQGSGATSAITPIAESNGAILMITLGSSPGLTSEKDYVFRSVPSDVYQASEMVSYLNGNLKPEKIAGLYVNDPYGMGIKDIVESDVNGEILVGELYDVGSVDFRVQLTKIKQSNPDVLIIVGRSNNYPSLLKQIKELGISATLLASTEFYDQSVLDKIGVDNVEGIYTLTPKDPQDYVNFKSNYVNSFGEEPSAYSMYAYDGTMSLIESIDAVGDDVDKVRDDLFSVAFNGASGRVGFDDEGDRTGANYAVYKVINGQFVKQ